MMRTITTESMGNSCVQGWACENNNWKNSLSSLLLPLRTVKSKFVLCALRIKSSLRRCLFSWACNGPLRLQGQLFLKLLNWQPVHLGKLGAIAKESMTVAASDSSYVVAPKFYGNRSLVKSECIPPLQAHELHGVGAKIIASPYSSAVLCGDQLYLPSHLLTKYHRIQTANGGFFHLEKSFAAGVIRPTMELKEGILIGGAGAFNWYHFVVEILPKLFLVEKLPAAYKNMPLLLPEECKNIQSFNIALKLFSGNRPIHFVRHGQCYGLKRLIVFDEVSIGPFNLALGEWPCISDYMQYDSVMRSFFKSFRSKVFESEGACGHEQKTGRRLFLTRPGIRRKYNQEDLLRIAICYGFEKFSPEEFTLHEQAKIFSEADVVIGPSGAAWVGILFNERSLKGLSWLPQVYEEFCCYSTMAHLLGHEIAFIESKNLSPLKTTGDVYEADYKICALEFETALKNILRED